MCPRVCPLEESQAVLDVFAGIVWARQEKRMIRDGIA
jgi:hypothetical protein